MSSAVKSFRKVTKATESKIEGTQNSPHNFSLLTSSGIAALDKLLGGGFPIGSLILIEEDEFGQYSETIAKYFVSEGLHSRHRVLYASKEKQDHLLGELPGEINIVPEKKPAAEGEDMTIAWRYNSMKITDSAIEGGGRLGHRLRLNTTIKPDLLDRIEKWPNQDKEGSFMEKVIETLQRNEHTIGEGEKQVARVVLLGLGSPQWPIGDVARILYLLRSWLRQSVAVGFVTVPAHLHKGSDAVTDWEHISDICIRLESFCGTDRANNPALKEYNGFLQVIKLPAFNSILPHIPPSDLAFKLRRRHFIIERLSLPPEMEDTTARGFSTACGGGSATNALDF